MKKKQLAKKLVEEKNKPVSSKVSDQIANQIGGFKDFLGKYSIITLALATVIGQSTKDVVSKLVDGIITPLLTVLFNLIIPQSNLESLKVTINGTDLLIGEFISVLIEMFLIMIIIYIVIGVVFKKKDLIVEKKK